MLAVSTFMQSDVLFLVFAPALLHDGSRVRLHFVGTNSSTPSWPAVETRRRLLYNSFLENFIPSFLSRQPPFHEPRLN